jgi:branched-chain amino acid transport system permease protein
VLLLLFLPGLRDRPELVDPLAGVDPPAPAPVTGGIDARAGRTLPIALAVGLAALVGALVLLSDFWLGKASEAVIMATIFLSFVMLTGLAGHLSLCQAAFAGIGAFTAAQLATEQGMSMIAGAFVGAAVAAVAGALVAIPSLRLSGLFLALGTLAFGLMVDSVIFPQPWVSGGGGGSMDVPRPLMGTVDFTSNGSFLMLSGVAFALIALFVWQLRLGSTGSFLSALRGSPTAAASIGIDERRARVIAFTLAAGIAGFGGALLATQRGEVAPVNFITDLSLYWTVVALAVGVATIRGAVAGGMLIVFVPEVLAELPERWLVLQFILFGLGVLVLARHPEGAFELIVSKFRRHRVPA